VRFLTFVSIAVFVIVVTNPAAIFKVALGVLAVVVFQGVAQAV
jgi:hypothetical protein